MKARLLAATMFAALFFPAAANAQKINLDTITCGAWLKLSEENIGMTLVWLDGYYQDEDADPIIDFGKVTENAKKLAAACAANPDKSLGRAAEDLFGN